MCKLAEDSNYDFSSWNTNAHKISQTIWNQQEIKNLKLYRGAKIYELLTEKL